LPLLPTVHKAVLPAVTPDRATDFFVFGAVSVVAVLMQVSFGGWARAGGPPVSMERTIRSEKIA